MAEIEDDVALFCDLYRLTFQRRATPKLHVLEAHLVEFMREWRALGLFGEDATESVHAKMHRLVQRATGVRNQIDRMRRIVKLTSDTQDPAAIDGMNRSREASRRKFKDTAATRRARKKAKAARKANA